MVYRLLIILLLLIALPELFFDKKYKFNKSKFSVAVIMVICAVLMGFRGNQVGIDTVNYIDLYKEIKYYSIKLLLEDFFWGSIECGFVLLNKISSLIFDSYYFHQCIVSIIYYYFSYKFIVNNVTTKPKIACLLFVCMGLFLMPLNITRQMLAVMISANSFTYVSKNKIVKALLLILLASTIHFTALLALIIPVFYYIKDKGILVKILPILSIIIVVLYQQIMHWVSSHIVKYATYYDNVRNVQEAGLGRIVWLITFGIALYIVYSKKFCSTKKVVANLVIIYIACGYVGTSFNYFERLGYYFLPFQILLFLDLGYSIRTRLVKRFYYLGVCFCFMILFILASHSSQYNYNTFF